jgi:hypothetical protein
MRPPWINFVTLQSVSPGRNLYSVPISFINESVKIPTAILLAKDRT